MTHEELVVLAESWLRKRARCSVVMAELVTYAPETPDAIGFQSDRSTLIECKASRADFLKDKKKWFRQNPEQGMGNYRYYLCPEGIIQESDLPEKWGLLWAKKGKVVIKREVKRNDDWFHANLRYERMLLFSALRRVV